MPSHVVCLSSVWTPRITNKVGREHKSHNHQCSTLLLALSHYIRKRWLVPNQRGVRGPSVCDWSPFRDRWYPRLARNIATTAQVSHVLTPRLLDKFSFVSPCQASFKLRTLVTVVPRPPTASSLDSPIKTSPLQRTSLSSLAKRLTLP